MCAYRYWYTATGRTVCWLESRHANVTRFERRKAADTSRWVLLMMLSGRALLLAGGSIYRYRPRGAPPLPSRYACDAYGSLTVLWSQFARGASKSYGVSFRRL